MKKRVGILTSGGDCPGLNATIRGVAKALYARFGENVEIVGILNGYHGLITGEYKEMCEDDFRGILTLGGTILGTKRTPFKMMRVVEDDNIDKVAAMKKTYKEAKLDCLLCLGGNGTHKTANLLSQEGLNIIGLPKTIDNDIYGTDVTFGFHTAVDIATDVIDRIHTTAGSHSRVMCIEIMGNKAGWLTLYSGIAGGADIILLPEQPYDIDRVCSAVERRAKKGSNFSIIAVAEGAINCEEAGMKRKEWMAKRAEAGFGTTATNRIAQAVQKKTGMETRVCIPGHMQRGGSPSAYDRVLATQFGSYAAQLVEVERYGVTVAMVNRRVTENRLADIAGKTRNVPENCELLSVARDQLTAELAGEQKFALYDFGEQTTKARCDEAAFVDALGEGTIAPELAGKADYYVFGYLTTLGKVKAQSGALGLSGRDRTVYAELSLRVMDAHTGAIVFVTKADSRRKAELSYNAIWQRHDSGEEDAIRAALEDAAINLAAQFKQAM